MQESRLPSTSFAFSSYFISDLITSLPTSPLPPFPPLLSLPKPSVRILKFVERALFHLDTVPFLRVVGNVVMTIGIDRTWVIKMLVQVVDEFEDVDVNRGRDANVVNQTVEFR